jgi:hypothetical protein
MKSMPGIGSLSARDLARTVGSEIGFTLELNDFTDALVLLRLGMFEPLHHPCSPILWGSHVKS